jgi:DNA end-binding protein Ku
VFPATKTAARISFNQIHKPSGKRIRYEKVVPGLGAVEADDIVKGYEVEKGKYILFTDDEIGDLKLEAKHTIDLVQFVDEDEIETAYFEKPYYVAPDDDEVAGEAYVVLRDALAATGKIGLGQIVVRGQASIVALKPAGKGLMIETLRYADELQKPETYFADVPEVKPEKELLSLATELIERKAKPFDARAFKNEYEIALRELIDAKLENRAPHEIQEPELGGKVIDLMEALKRSVKEREASRGKTAARPQRAAASSAKTPTKKSKPKASADTKSAKGGKSAGKGTAKAPARRRRAA